MSEPARCKLYNIVSRFGYMNIKNRLETDYIGPFPANGAVKISTFTEEFFGKIRFVENITELETALADLNIPANIEGARIILAPNTYILNSTIDLETRVTLEGEDKENTIIVANSPLTSAITATSKDAIQLKNLTIQFNHTVGIAVNFVSCDRVRIENCCINVNATNTQAVNFTTCSDLRFLNNIVNQQDITGLRAYISLTGGHHFLMNNTITNANTGGLNAFEINSQYIISAFNNISGGNVGIFSGAIQSVFVGNRFENQDSFGIFAITGETIISGNTTINTGGVQLSGAINTIVSKNNLISTGLNTGISITGDTQNSLIVSNNIQNFTDGINIAAKVGNINNYYSKNNIRAINNIVNASPNVLELVNNLNNKSFLLDGSDNPITIPDELEEFIISDITINGVFTVNLPSLGDDSTGRVLKIVQLANSGTGTINFSPNVLLTDSVTTLALSFAGVPTASAYLTWLGTIWRVGQAGTPDGTIA